MDGFHASDSPPKVVWFGIDEDSVLPVLLGTANVVSFAFNNPLLILGEAPLSDNGIGGVVVRSVLLSAGNSDGPISGRVHELHRVVKVAVCHEIWKIAITLSS